tara:strand:- start:1724 stop:3199 length:1476 start_codon:yes stop_codon:yes gene_type:complete
MNKWVFYCLLTLGIVLRFLHFGEAIDDPHGWRQSETANYIYDFANNGIDILHPSVCWLGNHKTLLLEFPLPEAMVAVLYQWFGESHIWGRLIFYLFFLGSLYYFYRLIALISNQFIAQTASLVYLFMPLSLFYSRALQVDFAALFFCNMMAVHFIQNMRVGNKTHLVLGILAAALAFLIKVPYAFAYSVVLIAIILQEKRYSFVFSNWYWLAIPPALFVLWQWYSYQTNAAAPDWEYIIGYRKFTDNSAWYYGDLNQRLDINNWIILRDRIYYEIIGISGLFLFVIGLIRAIIQRQYILIVWLLATVVYVLIFFNLNRIHNYYQIPFIPILAVLIAVGIDAIRSLLSKINSSIIATAFILLFGYEAFLYAEKNYYIIQHNFVEVGQHVQARTEAKELVIFNYFDLDSKCPLFLYQARRNGWQLLSWGLTPNHISRLKNEEGAAYFACIRNQPWEGEVGEYLSQFKMEKIDLQYSDHYLYFYDLKAVVAKNE